MKRTTMKDIAVRLGVSTSTVSRALNNSARISVATRERIHKAIHGSDYVRNMVARGLAVRRSHLIGVVVSSISNPFFAEIARGVHDVARSKSYVVALCNTERRVEDEESFSRALVGIQGAGMIFAGGLTGGKHLKWLVDQGVPLVLAGRLSKEFSVPTVAFDNVAVGYQGTQYLISRGYKHILFLNGPSNSTTSHDRQRGYVDAMKGSGLVPVVENGDFRMESGFHLANALAKNRRRVTAVFAANDMMAIGLILGCTNLGMRIPEDLAVVGCDDIPLASLIKPTLTTVRVPMYEMGARAMELLVAELGQERALGRQRILLGCELIERESAR